MKNKKVFLELFPIFCMLTLIIGTHAVLAANPCTITGGSIKTYDCSFDNPITGKDSIADLIQFVYDQLMPLAMMIAAIVILITGFRYVVAISGGKADLAGEAKKLFVPALIGAAIIVGGSAILKAVVLFAQGLS